MSILNEAAGTPDYASIKTKQCVTWGAGDYARVGSTVQVTGEQLAEALDLNAGDDQMMTQITPFGLMRERQAILRESYLSNPDLAMVTDYACTDSKIIRANHALHNAVSIDKHNTVDIVGGVHTAVGGDSDAPTPGDLLCGAIAACFDSTMRIIANSLGIELSLVRVEVSGRVDVRGTLMIDTAVPIGFQEFIVNVELNGSAAIPENQKRMLIRATERSCIVIQTLQSNPELTILIQLKS